MRLFIVPFIFIAILIHAPIPALGSTNQEAAEKIADSIGDKFPDATVDVLYQKGQVWLKGEAGSQEQRKKIVEHVFLVSGVKVNEVSDEIQIVAPRAVPKVPTQAARPATSAVAIAPAPIPKASPAIPPAPQMQPIQMQPIMQPMQQRVPLAQQAASSPQQQTVAGATMAPLAPYPYHYYPAAYGSNPGQPSIVPAPYTPTSYSVPVQAQQQQYAPQYGQQYRPAYYGPPAQAAHHPEAYGPQGPLPGQYNQPNLPSHAWPAYANYPNYAQVSYPRTYSPKAWPYIGPFYPYPQTPLGWRKVTLENHNGWWWLDFDDGTPSGPFSGLFRKPAQYRY